MSALTRDKPESIARFLPLRAEPFIDRASPQLADSNSIIAKSRETLLLQSVTYYYAADLMFGAFSVKVAVVQYATSCNVSRKFIIKTLKI